MSRQEKRVHWGSGPGRNTTNRDEAIYPDLIMFSGFGNVAVVITPEGLVVVDCSAVHIGPEIVRRIRARTEAPFHTIIYTHGHMDHAGGVWAFMQDAEARQHPRPKIIAQERLPKRFDRYRELGGHQLHMNRIQYGVQIDQDHDEWKTLKFFRDDIPYPDITYRDAMSFRLGGLTFELNHSLGETDDNTWVWIPERKTVVAGDAVKGGMPNIGNPFKVMLRYEVEWAEAMEHIAGRKPEYLIPGHGPVMNAETTREACLGQARFLRYVHDEVVRLLNQGCWLDEVLERVHVPDEILDQPYLRQVYGCLDFVIRGVYNRYAGWYNGRSSDLFPAGRSAVAAEVVSLGGARKLLDRVGALRDQGLSLIHI